MPLIIVALAAVSAARVGPAPVGTVLILLSAPLWFPALVRLRPALWLACALLLLGASGAALFLTSTGAADSGVAASVIGMTITGALLVGIFAWAAYSHGPAATAVAYGAGALLDVPLSHLPLDENGWKYYIAYPLALVVFGLLARRSLWFSVIALGGIAVASAVGGYRSMIAICAGALILTLLANYLGRRRISVRGLDVRPAVFTLGAVAAAGAGVVGFTQLLLSGLLGSRVQESTQLALSRGGDIITGGRVEWIATRHLFSERPWGYGPGYVPTETDKSGIIDSYATAGVEPSLQHLRVYVFDDRFKLHSLYGDFWVNFGPVATLVFLVVAVAILARFIIAATTDGRAPILLWFVFILALWDIAFSPIYTNLAPVLLSLVLLTSFALQSRHSDRSPS
ncbi:MULTISPECIES: hypothetical protein [Microbacterium]|uniref:hypothetical protein n=1 Tax=Microbacterium TaxID=33882 RepID=UPI0034509804